MLQAASGFARGDLMAWCEANDVDSLFGLARNKRLAAQVADALAGAEADSERSGEPVWRFADFMRSTRDSRGRERRVGTKEEWTHGKTNPRFAAASFAVQEYDARNLYEDLSCQRGEMENRIEECQLDLFVNGASADSMRANPAPPVVRVDGLCAALRFAPPRPRLHLPRRRHMRKFAPLNRSRSPHGSASASAALRSQWPRTIPSRTSFAPREDDFPPPQIEAAHNSPPPATTETSPGRTTRRQPTNAPTRLEISAVNANPKFLRTSHTVPQTRDV